MLVFRKNAGKKHFLSKKKLKIIIEKCIFLEKTGKMENFK